MVVWFWGFADSCEAVQGSCSSGGRFTAMGGDGSSEKGEFGPAVVALGWGWSTGRLRLGVTGSRVERLADNAISSLFFIFLVFFFQCGCEEEQGWIWFGGRWIVRVQGMCRRSGLEVFSHMSEKEEDRWGVDAIGSWLVLAVHGAVASCLVFSRIWFRKGSFERGKELMLWNQLGRWKELQLWQVKESMLSMRKKIEVKPSGDEDAGIKVLGSMMRKRGSC